nr:hypothetical protein [Candidatus Sigynarchaeota archaeon]
MKPPRCFLCGAWIPQDKVDEYGMGDDQGIIEFKKTKKDLEWDKKHFPEQAPYAEWFCAVHYPRAKSLSKHTTRDAIDILTAEFGLS